MPPKRQPKIIKASSPVGIQQLFRMYPSENSPNSWMLPNRLGYSDWVKSEFKYNETEHTKKDSRACPLFVHQRFIKDYLQPDSPYRGLLLSHSVGTGKTRSSISVAESMMPERKVVIMVPAALANNYVNEIRRCGSHMLRFEQHWLFAPKGSDKYKEKLPEFELSAKLLKSNGGIWYFDLTKPSNITTLSVDDRDSVERQLKEMTEKRYQFMHYNGGIKQQKLKEMVDKSKEEFGTSNLFDNKLVIIDEVHNFIGRVLGSAPNSVGKKLYKMLMEAKNLKIILLSGTPIINRPIELSCLLNLVRGYITLYTIKFKNKVPLEPKIFELLEQHMSVDYFNVRNDKSEIWVSFLPDGFEFVDKKQFMIKKTNSLKTLDEMANDLMDKLHAHGLSIVKKKDPLEMIPALPEDEEVFEQYFINDGAERSEDAIVNPKLLSRRVQGLVSYYNYYDPANYPELLPTEHVDLPMSDEQFAKYLVVRMKEIESERKQKQNNHKSDKKDQEKKKNGMYRALSRALCNFAFPGKIVRPFPSNIKSMLKEMESFEEDANGEKKSKILSEDSKEEITKEKLYERELKNVINKLTHEQLTSNLSELSPKYAYIVDKLNEGDWLSLVYSQFRNVEGLGLLSRALDAAGYVELKLKKIPKTTEYRLDLKPNEYSKPKYITFIGNKPESKILLDIYNSDFEQLPSSVMNQLAEMHPDWQTDKNHHGKIIKTLMITQSGAEGISLKNVREVHVLEPYWNDIRIQQVIGRAIRAKSHLALPREERNVKVYLYKMIFNLSQQKDKTIKSYDMNLTSDEYVHQVAQRKAIITEGLLSILKSAAVDCYLHKDKTGSICYKSIQDKDGANKFAYTQGGIDTDLKDHIVEQMVQTLTIDRAYVLLKKKDGEQLVYIKDNMLIYKETDVKAHNYDSPLGELKVTVVDGKLKHKSKWY